MPDILTSRGSPIVFKSANGNAAFNPSGITSGQARQSSQYDRGASAAPERYIWRARTKANLAPTIGNVVRVYLATSDGTDVDGGIPVTGQTMASLEPLRNMDPIGVIVADEASATKSFIRSGLIDIPERYVQVIFANDLGVALHVTEAEHQFTLTPFYPAVQS